MFGLDAPMHWVILVGILLALFGYKKLPDLTQSVGRSLRIFKMEMKGLADDATPSAQPEAPVAPAAAVLAPETPTDLAA